MTASGHGIIGTIRDSTYIYLCDKYSGEHKLINSPVWHTNMVKVSTSAVTIIIGYRPGKGYWIPPAKITGSTSSMSLNSF